MHHLLITCTLAKYTWDTIGPALKTTLTPETIIYGIPGSNVENYITSLTCFILYKYWLICNSKQKKRTLYEYRFFLRSELRVKLHIYICMKNYLIANKICAIISLID